MDDEEEMEEAAEAEVDKILFEITAGKKPCNHHPHYQEVIIKDVKMR